MVLARNELAVHVIALVFGQGEAARDTLQTAIDLDPQATCCMIIPPGEPLQLKDWWLEKTTHPLMVIREPEADRENVAMQIITLQSPGPLAVLIDVPERPRSWVNFFGTPREQIILDKIQAIRADIQVHPYSLQWRRRPPRII